MKLSPETIAQLQAAIPTAVVKQREGPKGRPLDYVGGEYVIGRLNEVFGPAGWSYVCDAERVHDEIAEKQNRKTKETWQVWLVSYVTRCTLYVNGEVVAVDHGAGHGEDRNRGIAIESAIKESNTDALKRCARVLGWSMGLALYDKTGAHVEKPEPAPLPGEGPESPEETAEELTRLHRQHGIVLLTPDELDAFLRAQGGKPMVDLTVRQRGAVLARLKVEEVQAKVRAWLADQTAASLDTTEANVGSAA